MRTQQRCDQRLVEPGSLPDACRAYQLHRLDHGVPALSLCDACLVASTSIAAPRGVHRRHFAQPRLLGAPSPSSVASRVSRCLGTGVSLRVPIPPGQRDPASEDEQRVAAVSGRSAGFGVPALPLPVLAGRQRRAHGARTSRMQAPAARAPAISFVPPRAASLRLLTVCKTQGGLNRSNRNFERNFC